MTSNAVALWLAHLVENATVWEAAAALVGVAAVGYALVGAIDNLFDLRAVTRDDPRWRTATFLLGANTLFLLSWLGYTHVAMTAVYLPARPDLSAGQLTDVSVMRLAYAVLGLMAQATLRQMRLHMRGLSEAQWAPLFGEAGRYKALYHAAQARLRRVEADEAKARADKHDALEREAIAAARGQLLERLLVRAGIEVPQALRKDQP